MIICDHCHNLEAKTLKVTVTFDTKKAFDGADATATWDLCRDCFDIIRHFGSASDLHHLLTRLGTFSGTDTHD